MAPLLLVCDDDPSVRGLLDLVLGEEFAVVLCEDGETALQRLTESPRRFDGVVLDVMMPGIDGFHVLSTVRTNPETEQLPVVMLTARVGEDDHLRGFSFGADAYVTKPFDPEQLLGVVRDTLALSPDQRAERRSQERSKAAFLRQLERTEGRTTTG